jgi:hypothetical protein
MAKRLRVNFHRPRGATLVDENGQAKPCAMGVGWVNPHTLQTLEKLHIARTDAKGRPLGEDADKR